MKIKEEWNIYPVPIGEKAIKARWGQYMDNKYSQINLQNHKGNFAVILGQISGNLFCIDYDFKINNKSQFQKVIRRIEEEIPDIFDTYIEETPNGYHVFYRINEEMPPNHNFKNTKKRFKTIFPTILNGIDLLGYGKYAITAPSTVKKSKYTSYNKNDIKTITREEYNKLYDVIIKDYTQMRKGFFRLLTGDIEIKNYSIQQGVPEHRYWDGLGREGIHRVNLTDEDMMEILSDTQIKEYDENKYRTQLKHHPTIGTYTDKETKKEKEIHPFSRPEYNILFPEFAINKKPIKPIKQTIQMIGLNIYNEIIEEFDIWTMDDSNKPILRKGNIYVEDLKDFTKALSDKVLESGLNYDRTYAFVEKLINHRRRLLREDFCFEEDIINFKNGYYSLKDGFINKNDKKFAYEIPHQYNKNFVGNCPEFEKMLDSWLDKNGTIIKDDIYEMIGYSMTMNTDQKKAFFIYGPTNTGKTQFQTILEGIIGHDNRANVSLQRLCRDHFGAHGLQFKILDMVGDMSTLSIKDVGKFKELTGDDIWIHAEVKGGDGYDFRNIIKIWYNANKFPYLEDKDNAFYERWIIISFPNQFDEFNKDTTIKRIGKLLLKNETEIQAIIHKSIKGLIRLQERTHFRKEVIISSTHIWKYQSDSVYAFISDMTEFSEYKELSWNEFKDRYKIYCRENDRNIANRSELPKMAERNHIILYRDWQDNNRGITYIRNIKWKDNG